MLNKMCHVRKTPKYRQGDKIVGCEPDSGIARDSRQRVIMMMSSDGDLQCPVVLLVVLSEKCATNAILLQR